LALWLLTGHFFFINTMTTHTSYMQHRRWLQSARLWYKLNSVQFSYRMIYAVL